MIHPFNPILDRVRKGPEQDSIPSPITPNYRFGHDDHYDKFHYPEKTPNLHDHSHAHDSHEGHSHNMRGVFLHVMAVGYQIRFLPDFADLCMIGHPRVCGCDHLNDPDPLLRMDGI